MIDFKRKKGESFENFLRRFNRSLIKSRRLNEVRRRKFLQPKTNKNKQKERALKSMRTRAKNEYLRKTGKLSEEAGRRW